MFSYFFVPYCLIGAFINRIFDYFDEAPATAIGEFLMIFAFPIFAPLWVFWLILKNIFFRNNKR